MVKNTKKGPPPPRGARKKRAAPPATAETSGISFSMPEEELPPQKIVIVATEGYGKTTVGASTPKPGLIMAEGETGYKTLYGMGRAPAIPNVETISWEETMDAVDVLAANKKIETIVLDEQAGMNRQCTQHHVTTDYGGDFHKFMAYHKGYNTAPTEWLKLLSKLERTGKTIIMLSHCRIIEIKNDPMNASYHRYVADVHEKIWAETRRWADIVLFGNFLSIVDKKGKGVGGDERMLYTEHRDTHDAKNRHGMEPEIEMGDDPEEMWPIVEGLIYGKEEGDE